MAYPNLEFIHLKRWKPKIIDLLLGCLLCLGQGIETHPVKQIKGPLY